MTIAVTVVTSFHISTEEVARVEHPFIKEKLASMELDSQITQSSFQSRIVTRIFWHGRPDIIVGVWSKKTGELKKMIIGQIKDTKQTEYVITGVRELIDYMELVKDKNGVYLKDRDEGLVEDYLLEI